MAGRLDYTFTNNLLKYHVIGVSRITAQTALKGNREMNRTIFVYVLLVLLLAACGDAPAAPVSDEVYPAPDFTLPNALGGEVSLSDYAGKPVFLFFHMAVG